MATDIRGIGLQKKTLNALLHENPTVEVVCDKTVTQLLRVPMFGKIGMKDLATCVVSAGYDLPPDWDFYFRQSAVEQPKKDRLANLTGGSRKGIPNKTTALLKDAILQAATKAGGKEGLVGYLTKQATETPASFLPLLGKVLPMQVTGEDGGPVQITRIELVGVAPE